MRQLFNPLTHRLAIVLDKLSRSKLTANHLTIIGLLLHLPVAFLISQCYLIYGGIGLILVASLDAIDGQLATIQNKVSDFGGWLDATSDRAKEVIIFSALIYHLSDIEATAIVLSLAGMTLGISLLVSYSKAKAEVIIATKDVQEFSKLNRLFGGGLASYELRVLLLAIALITNQILIGLIIISSLGIITIIYRSSKFYKTLQS